MRKISVKKLKLDKTITSMQNKTSTVVDYISNVIVKVSRAAILALLKVLIDRSIKSASFKGFSVRAVVQPLYKEESKLILRNYRPNPFS